MDLTTKLRAIKLDCAQLIYPFEQVCALLLIEVIRYVCPKTSKW